MLRFILLLRNCHPFPISFHSPFLMLRCLPTRVSTRVFARLCPPRPSSRPRARPLPRAPPRPCVLPPNCLVHSLPQRIRWPLPQEAQAPTRLRRHRVRVYCSPSRPHVCVLGRPRARAPDAKGGPGISSGRTRRGKRGLWEGAWDGGGLMYVEGRACV
jgi:hypothetical protein